MNGAYPAGRLVANGKGFLAKLFCRLGFNIETEHPQKGLNPELASSRCAELVSWVFAFYASLENFPLLHGIDRDYMMVTYSDFMRAVIGEDVEAFSIFSRKKAFVRTGDFPEGRLPKPFRKAAGSVRAKEYDMSSLLADVH